MRCRCGLLKGGDRAPYRAPWLCQDCKAEGWTLTPAGYVQVYPVALPAVEAELLPKGRPTGRPRRKAPGRGKGKGR